MLVRDLMTTTVVTIDMDDSLDDVRRIFDERGFHHLVVREGDRVVGVVSDRDLLRNLSPFVGRAAERTMDLNSLRRRVHQFMTRSPITVTPEWSAAEAGRLLLSRRIGCLPVLSIEGELVGIVTTRDLARTAVELLAAVEARAREADRPACCRGAGDVGDARAA